MFLPTRRMKRNMISVVSVHPTVQPVSDRRSCRLKRKEEGSSRSCLTALHTPTYSNYSVYNCVCVCECDWCVPTDFVAVNI